MSLSPSTELPLMRDCDLNRSEPVPQYNVWQGLQMPGTASAPSAAPVVPLAASQRQLSEELATSPWKSRWHTFLSYCATYGWIAEWINQTRLILAGVITVNMLGPMYLSMPFAIYGMLTAGAAAAHWYWFWGTGKGDGSQQGVQPEGTRNTYQSADVTEHLCGTVQYDQQQAKCCRLSLTQAGQRRCRVFWLGTAIFLDVLVSCALAAVALGMYFLVCEEPDGRIVDSAHGLAASMAALSTLALFTLTHRVIQFIAFCLRTCSCSCCCTCGSCCNSYLACTRLTASGLSKAVSRRALQVGWVSCLALFVISFGWFLWTLASIIQTQVVASDGDYKNCEPLDGSTGCLLPYPSSFFLVDDPTTPTGYRVNVPTRAMPYTKFERHLPGDILDHFDGFSTMGAMVFHLPGLKEKCTNSLLRYDVLNSYPASFDFDVNETTTLIIDAETLERHPHFAEVDYLDIENPSVLVQPILPLRHGRRYIVAARGVGDGSNSLDPLPTYRDLADAYVQGDPSQLSEELQARYPHYATTVFPVLEAAGLQVDKLQIAWDFVTASGTSQLGVLRAMKSFVEDDTMRRVNNGEKLYKQILFKENSVCTQSRSSKSGDHLIWLTFDAPWFLNSNQRDADLLFSESDITTNSSGVVTDGYREVGMLIRIPCKVLSGKVPPKALLQFGHSIFNDRSEALDEYAGDLAEKNGWIVFAVDWRGFSRFDVPVFGRTLLYTPDSFQRIVYGIWQGYANNYLGQAVVTEFLNRHYSKAFGDVSSLPFVFYGNSMGGILGSGYTAFAGTFERAILGVPGVPFSMLLTRSLLFGPPLELLNLAMFGARQKRVLLGLLQQFFDSVEGAGWYALLQDSRVNGTQSYLPFPILIQAGLGDASVTTIGAENLARAIAAKIYEHTPIPVWGLDVYTDSLNATYPTYVPGYEEYFSGNVPSDRLSETHPGSALFEILYRDEYKSIPKKKNTATEFNWVHQGVRYDDDAQEQLSVFVTNHTIINPCPDVCSHKSCPAP